MDTSTVFPLFEKGLPLRSRDLNAVFRRADAEVRHTRTCLHGMGILYGLHVTAEAAKITIQPGAGVTSEGHLYCSHTPVELTTLASSVSKIITREFKAESFGDYLDRPSTTDELNDTVAHLELSASGTLLTSEELTDKWLIVFFEVVTEDLKGCATCDKGKRATILTRFLLIDDKVWSGDTGKPGLVSLFDCGESLQTAQTNTFTPTPQKLPRIGLLDNSCIQFDEAIDLREKYESSINSSFPAIKDELVKTCKVADVIFGLKGADVVSTLDIPTLLTDTNGQYVHDYLRLIIRAYDEFVATPFTRHIANLPPETCFPKHLVLGQFGVDPATNQLKFLEEKRTPFYRPIFAGTTDTDFEYARQLYERLISLLVNQDFGNLDAKKELRITPSRRATFSVGMQAIPFYLKLDEVQKTWRPASQFDALLLGYDIDKRLQNQPFFDEADFYRIEGYVGQRLESNNDGKNQVEVLRDCLNLPFQVVVINATGGQGDRPFLSDFARQNPGLEHQGGVASGGTFVMVVESEGNTVVADFSLPYWVQPPAPKPVIADFEVDSRKTIPGQGESFTFINTSKNYDRLEWRVDGGDSLSDEELFTFMFPVTELLVTHYFVTLTAIKGERESVEKTTIVVVHIKDQALPPKADFAVEEQDNVETSEDGDEIKVTFTNAQKPFKIKLTFQNKSENADEFLWHIDGNLKSKAKDKISHQFSWVAGEDEPQTFTIQLTATKDGLIDIAEKTVTAILPPVNPPIK